MNIDHVGLAKLTAAKRRRFICAKETANVEKPVATLGGICAAAFIGTLVITVISAIRVLSCREGTIYALAFGVIGATLCTLIAACGRALIAHIARADDPELDFIRNIRGAFVLIWLRLALISAEFASLLALYALLQRYSESANAKCAVLVLTLVLSLVFAVENQGLLASYPIFSREDISLFRAVGRSLAVTRGRRCELFFVRLSALLRFIPVILTLGFTLGSFIIGEINIAAEYSRYCLALYKACEKAEHSESMVEG